MDVLEKTIHQSCVLHEDGDGLPGLKRIRRLKEFIVQPGLIDSLGRLSD